MLRVFYEGTADMSIATAMLLLLYCYAIPKMDGATIEFATINL